MLCYVFQQLLPLAAVWSWAGSMRSPFRVFSAIHNIKLWEMEIVNTDLDDKALCLSLKSTHTVQDHHLNHCSYGIICKSSFNLSMDLCDLWLLRVHVWKRCHAVRLQNTSSLLWPLHCMRSVGQEWDVPCFPINNRRSNRTLTDFHMMDCPLTNGKQISEVLGWTRFHMFSLTALNKGTSHAFLCHVHPQFARRHSVHVYFSAARA